MSRLLFLLPALWLNGFSPCLAAVSWKEILLAPAAELPPTPSATITWRTDLAAATAEARKENRPLFVTFRCLPCKQCSAFDKAVLEGGPELDPLLRRFVTVRLTDAAQMDIRLFPVEGFQDLDLSWWGWFLSPEGRIYGVYGGRDHVSDATRISEPSLAATLRRVLDHHFNPHRSQWNVDGPPPDMTTGRLSPRELPGYAGWMRSEGPGAKKQECIHCHQVNDILRLPAVEAKTFDKQRDFDVWPLPENVGLTVDRDQGLLVKEVALGSPAAKAGLRPGDVLGASGGRCLFSQTDFRGVLHRGPRGAGEIEVWWRRGPDVMSGSLAVADGWRKTILDWRMSVSQGIVGANPGFFPLGSPRREAFQVPADKMAVEPFMGPKPGGAAFDAGVRQSQVITAVNGETPNLIGRAFLVWFVQRHDPGDRVTLTIADAPAGSREVTYQLPPRGQ